jgi:hypothetical protein
VQAPDSRSIAAAFADPASFGVTLLHALLGAYGVEPLKEDWLADTVAMELSEDFKVRLSPPQLGKLMAAICIVKDPGRLYGGVPDFITLANALGGSGIDPATFDPADAMECAWAITEAIVIRALTVEPEAGEDSTPELDPQVSGYIGAVLEEEGIVRPPDVLRAAAHDPDRMARVMGEFADDPAMFDAINAAETAKTADINAEIRARLRLMIDQLARLYRSTVAEVVEEFGLDKVAGGG